MELLMPYFQKKKKREKRNLPAPECQYFINILENNVPEPQMRSDLTLMWFVGFTLVETGSMDTHTLDI